MELSWWMPIWVQPVHKGFATVNLASSAWERVIICKSNALNFPPHASLISSIYRGCSSLRPAKRLPGSGKKLLQRNVPVGLIMYAPGVDRWYIEENLTLFQHGTD